MMIDIDEEIGPWVSSLLKCNECGQNMAVVHRPSDTAAPCGKCGTVNLLADVCGAIVASN